MKNRGVLFLQDNKPKDWLGKYVFGVVSDSQQWGKSIPWEQKATKE